MTDGSPGTPRKRPARSFFLLGNSAFLRIPVPVWICIACFVAFGLLLSRTVGFLS